MSEYGTGIIERLPDECGLKKPDNHVRKIIDNGLGTLLDELDPDDFFNQFFITDATGKYLDLFGAEYGVKRKVDEGDDDYRKRIVLTSLSHLTVPYLESVYGLKVYSYNSGFDGDSNVLVSDNIYYNHDGFMVFCDSVTRQLLESKFILGNELHFME